MSILYVVHTNALTSVYQDSTDKSRQTSQLLFGEICVVKSERDDFYFIENYDDKHCGWVNKTVFQALKKIEFERLEGRPIVRITSPLACVCDLQSKTTLHLPIGSIIHDYEPKTKSFAIAKEKYEIDAKDISHLLVEGSLDNIVHIALLFLNAPFMYGGKSILGIDKSGLNQLIFSLCGYFIPRSLQSQVKIGVPVYSIDQLRLGDVIFIQSEDVVIDSYIYLGDDRLLGIDDKVKVIDILKLKNITSVILIRRLV